jgi:hypothetical protein
MQKKHIFSMKLYPKTLNIQTILDLIYVYQYHHHKKFTQEFHSQP